MVATALFGNANLASCIKICNLSRGQALSSSILTLGITSFGKRVNSNLLGPYDIVTEDYGELPGPGQNNTLAALAGNLNKIPNIFVRISLWHEYVPNPKIPPYMQKPKQWYVPNAAA